MKRMTVENHRFESFSSTFEFFKLVRTINTINATAAVISGTSGPALRTFFGLLVQKVKDGSLRNVKQRWFYSGTDCCCLWWWHERKNETTNEPNRLYYVDDFLYIIWFFRTHHQLWLLFERKFSKFQLEKGCSFVLAAIKYICLLETKVNFPYHSVS